MRVLDEKGLVEIGVAAGLPPKLAVEASYGENAKRIGKWHRQRRLQTAGLIERLGTILVALEKEIASAPRATAPE